MRYILVLTLLFSFLYTDEIKRVESIIKDITELREENEVCKKELDFAKNKQIKKCDFSSKEKKYKEEINKLKEKITKYKKLLNNKNKEIQKLKNLNEAKKIDSVFKQKKFDKPNEFPNLVLKPKYIKYKIEMTKPTTYRLKYNAKIYNKIDGKVIVDWEKGVSFTTNIKATLQKKDSWLRITGFFINGKWVKSQSQMWVKTIYAKKR